ncbi:hypothetical protein LCGC14_3098820 [marine sediment metagenome]|uniref:Uncharacterized protein n=1 Tax=marine sediment metagenome TaxID=412755 RepID=A0A0F8WX72_9ZZZZ
MYRPENPFAEGGRLSHLKNADIKEYGFEAGLDAMLQCLKRQQVTVPDILYWWITTKGRKERKKGYLVFIPEDSNATK